MTNTSLTTTYHEAVTEDGWLLSLKRVFSESSLATKRCPLAIIPGYGMNSFIFGYHPNGLSMEAFFALQGFEVWSADLRGQGRSAHPDGWRPYDLEDLALTDLTTLFRAITEHTLTDHHQVHAIGCSLGGSLLFAHEALTRDHFLRSLVAMGAPLRWERVHPILRLLTSVPSLIRHLPARGIRDLASIAFPLALRFPKVLHPYLHPAISDTSDYEMLLNTVEDTSPTLNQDVARWIQVGDLVVAGEAISPRLQNARCPLLCVIANADGIVPAETALSAHQSWGHPNKDVLIVGTGELRFAHADLFISDYSQQLVFDPIARWLTAHN